MARLLAFAGHEVEREYYYNDAGAQMMRFRASVEARRRGEEPPEDGYHGDYIAELAQRPDDPVPLMLQQIEATLKRFRIGVDSWARQSELEQRLPEFLPRLDTYERDGALWARSSAYGDDDDRVLIRSETGTPTYRAADVVYLADKLDRGFDRAVYVLGADHHGTRNWYAAVARMLGHDPDRVEVLLYQLVHLTRARPGREDVETTRRRRLPRRLPRRGRRRRRPLVPRLPRPRPGDRDRRRPGRRAEPEEPGLLRPVRARPDRGDPPQRGRCDPSAEPPATLEPEERELVKRLAEFPAVVAEATERRGPHAIPTYAIRVADDFHRFYTRHKVLGSESEAFRLGLITATKSVIARALDLIGVEAPERM